MGRVRTYVHKSMVINEYYCSIRITYVCTSVCEIKRFDWARNNGLPVSVEKVLWNIRDFPERIFPFGGHILYSFIFITFYYDNIYPR